MTVNENLGTYDEFVEEYGGEEFAPEHIAKFVRNSHARLARSVLERANTEGRGLAATSSGDLGDLRADERRQVEFHKKQIDRFDEALDAGKFGARSRKVAESRQRLGIDVSRSEDQGSGYAPGVDNRSGWSAHGGEKTYRKNDPSAPSWAKDMVAANIRGDQNALERLRRNTEEVAVETRALTTTDGAGGEFVPPLWMVDNYVTLARARRVTANLVNRQVLPSSTDTINLPKVATGTATAEQASQNTAVQNTDATTGSITGSVTTLAGQQVISLQLIEQSPINMDEMLLNDLLADLAGKTDLFVINNNAAGKYGLLQMAGTNLVTYTSASPTVALLYPKIADAIQQIATNRFDSADAIVMHPRRWAWLLAAVDANNRPLVVPAAQGPYNAFGQYAGPANGAGYVGEIAGLPVYVDPLIPINLGAGTNEDRIIVLKRDDHVLFEGVPRAEAFRETKADTLSVLLRVYNYVAELTRYPKGITVIAGTGLTTPSF